ncbi:MAG: TraX family protein [Oscillospiraceae bacterium]|nr:TraX family protein [Oscillospiraceae bacterium]
MLNEATSYPRFACLSAFWLKLIALGCMVCDHIGYLGLSGLWWLRLIGRMAFPIYAFLLVEGFYNTRSRARYALRLLSFALLSELPFNLLSTGGFSLRHSEGQNVMFELLLGLLLLMALEEINLRWFKPWQNSRKPERYDNFAVALLLASAAVAAACYLADLLELDYHSYGIMLVAAMYLFRGCLPLVAAGQAAVFMFIMPRVRRTIPLFGTYINTYFYGWAVLSMIPIALYNGKPGVRSRAVQYAFYLAYPLHMLVLALIARY